MDEQADDRLELLIEAAEHAHRDDLDDVSWSDVMECHRAAQAENTATHSWEERFLV